MRRIRNERAHSAVVQNVQCGQGFHRKTDKAGMWQLLLTLIDVRFLPPLMLPPRRKHVDAPLLSIGSLNALPVHIFLLLLPRVMLLFVQTQE